MRIPRMAKEFQQYKYKEAQMELTSAFPDKPKHKYTDSIRTNLNIYTGHH